MKLETPIERALPSARRFYFAGLLFHGRLDVELFITDTLIPTQIRAPRQH